MSTPCYYGELDQDNCSFFIHGVDVQDAIRQAHRAGWEQAKAEALFIVQNYEHNPDRDGDFADQLDEEIAVMEYMEG